MFSWVNGKYYIIMNIMMRLRNIKIFIFHTQNMSHINMYFVHASEDGIYMRNFSFTKMIFIWNMKQSSFASFNVHSGRINSIDIWKNNNAWKLSQYKYVTHLRSLQWYGNILLIMFDCWRAWMDNFNWVDIDQCLQSVLSILFIFFRDFFFL